VNSLEHLRESVRKRRVSRTGRPHEIVAAVLLVLALVSIPAVRLAALLVPGVSPFHLPLILCGAAVVVLCMGGPSDRRRRGRTGTASKARQGRGVGR
jgi:hypothetical protein